MAILDILWQIMLGALYLLFGVAFIVFALCMAYGIYTAVKKIIKEIRGDE